MQKKIKLYEKDICGANLLRVSAGTTGHCGGDAGHGGHTIIEIEDLGGTEISCYWDQERRILKIELFGDSELDTISEAFSFICDALNRWQS